MSCMLAVIILLVNSGYIATQTDSGFTAHVYHTSLRWDSSDDMISMKVANFSNGLVMGQYKDSDSQISRFFQGWVTSVQVEEDLVSYTNEHPVNKTLFSQNFKNEILLSYDSAIATVTGASMATQFDSGSLTAVKS
ncbi:uncharacterized protein [Ptychodera flava]|uniref:uncharacterized protein isoform X2 n=1 Tax=Ptychodera flava TaxID=63121 RepID=UPI003969DCE0